VQHLPSQPAEDEQPAYDEPVSDDKPVYEEATTTLYANTSKGKEEKEE
jgi:hypothetical protein